MCFFLQLINEINLISAVLVRKVLVQISVQVLNWGHRLLAKEIQ